MTKRVVERVDAADGDGAQFYFWCPGCETHHAPNHSWSFNGDYEKPTFSPSVLVTRRTADGVATCHLFVRDGMLVFLHDCTHGLAGKRVPMVPID
jgi:hypothetical protein